MSGRFPILFLVLLLLGGTLLAVASAQRPERADPFDGSSGGVSQFAGIAEELGYEVRTSLMGENTFPSLDPRTSLRVIVDSAPRWDEGDGRGLAETVRSGARVLVADRENAAPILAPWGWTPRFAPIYQGDVTGGAPEWVDLNWEIDGRAHSVPARLPRALTPTDEDSGEQATLIHTTNRTFADLDGDGTLSKDEDVRGPFVVGVDFETPTGGRLVVVTSPSVLTNEAAKTDHEQAFREELLLSMLPDGGTVVFDLGAAPRPSIFGPLHDGSQAIAGAIRCLPCVVATALVASVAGGAASRARGTDMGGWITHRARLDNVRTPTSPSAGGDGATNASEEPTR